MFLSSCSGRKTSLDFPVIERGGEGTEINLSIFSHFLANYLTVFHRWVKILLKRTRFILWPNNEPTILKSLWTSIDLITISLNNKDLLSDLFKEQTCFCTLLWKELWGSYWLVTCLHHTCGSASLISSSSSISSVQSLSHVRLFATPWITARQASLCITNSRSLLKLMPIESVIPSNRLISDIPFSSCPQSLPASGSFPMSLLFHEVANVLEFQL